MKNNKLIFISGIILFLIGLFYGVLYLFFVNGDVTVINNVINKVNNEEIVDASSFKSIRNEETINYLNDLIDDTNYLNSIVKEEKFINILELTSKDYEDIKKYKNEIKAKSKEALENIKGLKLDRFEGELKEVNTDLYEKKYNSIIEDVKYVERVVVFLTSNNDKMDIVDKSVVFNKRHAMEEFDGIDHKVNYIKKIDYRLIDDKEGPVINANNISVTVGASLDIKSKVSCEDAVDGKVECSVSSYSTSKVGTYKVTISAKDIAGNSSSKTITLTVNKKIVNTKPYYIEVIRNQNVVVVYGLDSNNDYTRVVKVFTVSVGKNGNTPTGTFSTTKGNRWGSLFGGVYGQYSTRITGHILFHSVPYYKASPDQLEWEEYNKLGTAASAGCIRMRVIDVKWIYDNCPVGTKVKIYDGSLPKGVSKPSVAKISASSPNRGWDPTDPDSRNPWKK